MEDVHRVVPGFETNPSTDTYLGVYDGHGGRQIVEFIETRLENNIAAEIMNMNDDDAKNEWMRPQDAKAGADVE